MQQILRVPRPPCYEKTTSPEITTGLLDDAAPAESSPDEQRVTGSSHWPAERDRLL